MHHDSPRSAFTLIELLVVIAIIAILSVVVILTLNPAELLRQSRDANRLSDIQTLNSAIGLANLDGLPLGTPNIIYVSIPDPTISGNATSTCGSLGLPSLSSTLWSYQCVSSQNARNIQGKGWIPIAFNAISSGAPISSLPIDGVNNTSTHLFYAYTSNGLQYEIISHDESQKYAPSGWTDGGRYSDLQEQGTNLKLFPIDLGGGNIYVTDGLQFDNTGIYDFSITGKQLARFTSSELGVPSGIAVGPNGNIYITDWGYGAVLTFDPTGKYLFQFSTSTFSDPDNIAIDTQGNIYVSDESEDDITKFDASGKFIMEFSGYGSGDINLNHPFGIAVDKNGIIYVVNAGDNNIKEFYPNGTYDTQFGSFGESIGEFDYPYGIAIDANGNIYIVDTGNNRVEEFHTNGTVTSIGSLGSGDYQFNNPQGIAVDQLGNIYVADSGNNRVEIFNASGTYMSRFGSLAGALNIGIQQ